MPRRRCAPYPHLAPTPTGPGCVGEPSLGGPEVAQDAGFDAIACSARLTELATDDANEALALYRFLRSEGVPISLVACTAVVGALCRAGRLESVRAVLATMAEDGCGPHAVAHSSLVHGYCLQGDLPGAVGTLQEMSALGLVADALVFNYLLSACIRRRNWALADAVLEELRMQSVEPTAATSSLLVRMWARRGDLERAIAIAFAMASPISADIGREVIGACVRHAAVERGLEVFRSWETRGGFDGPDDIVRELLASGLRSSGRWAEAATISRGQQAVLP